MPRTAVSLILLAALISRPVLAAGATTLDIPIKYRGQLATIELGIGTPPKKHTLLFDTGSSDAWVLDQACAESCENSSGYNRTGYDPSSSSTHHPLGTHHKISYLTSIVKGAGTADAFSLPVSEGCSPAWNQTFLSVNDSTAATIPVDGFVGMGFPSGENPGMKTLVEALVEEGLLAAPRFGIYYGRTAGGTTTNVGDGGAVLTIGGSREEEFVAGGESGMKWLPVTKFGSRYVTWASGSSSITTRTGGGAAQDTITPPEPLIAIFDTGSSVTLLPREHFDTVYASLGWNGTAVVLGEVDMPCDAFNASWSVAFSVGGTAPGDDLTTLEIRGDQVRTPGYRDSVDLCWPPFGMIGDGILVVGAPVLRRLYTVWDFGGMAEGEYKPRVGFGVLKEGFRPSV